MLHHPHRTGLGSFGLPLALTALLSAPFLAASPPALAEHIPQHQPDRRLELLVSSIKIHNDSDPNGTGEWKLGVVFAAEPGGEMLHRTFRNNDARSGQTWNVDAELSPLPIFPGQNVRVQFAGTEDDGGWFDTDDYLGIVRQTFAPSNSWGIGDHTQRSTTGNYSVTYTIRNAPLPDLAVTEIGEGSNEGLQADIPSRLCVRYRNLGTQAAGPFVIQILVDDQVRHTAERPHLPSSGVDVGWTCADLTVSGGNHKVAAILDTKFEVDEFDETNNRAATTLNGGVLVPPDNR